MPENLEFKAKIISENDIKKVLKDISAKYIETIIQIDTYYYSNYGRLKIREIDNSEFQLIFYQRDEEDIFRLSNYEIYKVNEVDKLKKILKESLGEKAIVRKKRELYIYKNCRIHLDEVDNLGKFIEFELMGNNQNPDTFTIIEYLHNAIKPYIYQIYKESYVDLVINCR